MSYTNRTQQILTLINESDEVLKALVDFNKNPAIQDNNTKYNNASSKLNEWVGLVIHMLESFEMALEVATVKNIIARHEIILGLAFPGLRPEENKVRKVIDELVAISHKIEDEFSKKKIELIKIEDIDNFKNLLLDVNVSELMGKYDSSAFLEDDVENVFMELIGESPTYKENDSGAETRDLFTDRIFINGKRFATAIMFKGRGIKGELRIKDCGKNGDQLLKLSKNASSEFFIVQHVNKINPEVREALYDHLMTHAVFPKIKMCFIDGLDTARILKGGNKNLNELAAKKSSIKKANPL